MSQRHLRRGDANPQLNPDIPRLYSMRFCPFAHRVLLVLHAKGINHEVVNINLVDPPEFFTRINPYGGVPTFQYRGKIVADGQLIVEFIEELFPEKPVSSKDPSQKARDREVEQKFDLVAHLVKKISLGQKDAQTQKAFLEGITKVERLLTARKTPFFGGDECGIADFNVWPWFIWMDDTVLDAVPELKAWTSRMRSVPAVKATDVPKADYEKFQASLLTGRPVFDF